MIFYEEDKEKYQIVPAIRLKEAQTDAIDFVLHQFNCVVNVKTGVDKCKLGSSRVFTDNGYERLDSICKDIPYGATRKNIRIWTGEGWSHTKYLYKEKDCRVIKWLS